ncbi:MAG: MFS transporter [Xanthomonadales bacterium]|nr:MFS transporter [Xanthomonadales bacterium]
MKKHIPKMAAALVPRELTNWSLTSITLGALEGGLLGVIVKNQFADVASPAAVNLAVAIVAGAPSFTNLASFLYSSWSSGRDKLRIMSRLMQVMGIATLLMALPPANATGLFLFCLLTVVARTAWSGILTLRASVWRANYPRDWRAQITAKLVRLSSLLVAAVAALVGFLLDWQDDFYRPCFVLAGICSLFAARIYGKARIRRHQQLLAKERAAKVEGRRHISLAVFGEVLRGDRDFRNYMWCMMVFGGANLMVIPMLVVMLNEQFHLSQWHQVMVTSSLPLVIMCFAVPRWARLLDRKHIFAYRALHSWYYVLSYVFFALALGTGTAWLLWPAAMLLGGANAGGHLGWNLGHNDFTNDANAAQYMAVHVSLTGLRGIFMPLLGIGFYQFLSHFLPVMAPHALLFPLFLSAAGAAWFVILNAEHSKRIIQNQGLD